MLAVLSLWLPFYAGLGGWSLLAAPGSNQNGFLLIHRLLLAGILLQTGLDYAFWDLPNCDRIGIVLSGMGWVILGWRVWRGQMRVEWSASRPVLLVLGLVALFFTLKILGEPLAAWDARSTWFFHAKLMRDSLLAHGHWGDPFIEFSHPGYPKLLPLLAAQVSRVAGYWNEYLPKAALLPLFFSALSGLIPFLRANFSSAGLFSLLFLAVGPWLWNGYLDAYLAIFIALGAFHLTEKRGTESLICFAFAASLKNEGLLLCALTLVSALLVFGPREFFRRTRSWAWLAFVTPLLWWWLRNTTLGLGSDLDWGPGYLSRAWMRLGSPRDLDLLTLHLFWKSLWIRAAMIFAAVAWVARPLGIDALDPADRDGFFLLLASAACLTLMAVAYLCTARELAWHLANSSDRTLMSSMALLFIAGFRIARRAEAVAFPRQKDAALDFLKSVITRSTRVPDAKSQR